MYADISVSQHRVENGENKLLGVQEKKVTRWSEGYGDLQPSDDEDLQSSVQDRHDERKKWSRSIMMTQNNSSQDSLSSTQADKR